MGLIEPMLDGARAHASVIVQKRNRVMFRVDRVSKRRSEGDCGARFFARKRPTGRKHENGRVGIKC
jgi:hypothetical protein